MSDSKNQLIIDARMENLPTISDFIFSTARQLDIKQDILKIQVAVEEACTNIIKHAYSGQGGNITISCELRDNALVITIKDNAGQFDPATVPPPNLETDLENRQIGKLGLHLMKKLMDEVSYSYDPKEGNILIMKKDLAKL